MSILTNHIKKAIFFLIFITISSCGIYKPVDTRKVSVNANERTQANIEEGKGFKVFDTSRRMMSGGAFQFANSNGLWRASLDVIDFMPLTSVNYSGGIIITDWYSDSKNPNESIKISIRFLTNEIRSDALDIKIFTRKCIDASLNCSVSNLSGNLSNEIKKEILKKAARYKEKKFEESPDKDFVYPDTSGGVF